MTGETEVRAPGYQQTLGRSLRMRSVTIGAGDLAQSVFALPEIVTLFLPLVTFETTTIHLLDGFRPETEDLREVPAAIRVFLARAVAGFASLFGFLPAFLHGGDEVRSSGEMGECLIMTYFAGLGTRIP